MKQQIKYYHQLEEFQNSSLQSHQVLHIDLSENEISDQGVLVLGSALENCTNLSNLTLCLVVNQIGDQGASALGFSLANCTNLSNLTLDFRGNEIGDQGALVLGFTLANCTNLSKLELYLGENQIHQSQQLKVKSKCLKSKRLVTFEICFY
ncbi:DNA topoisomerase, putative (macronuclear) [Tetrahymena thermophila SB210]|uniref:DNA topoisomerase, putative n=1 Tax=Tetrahymena thermophila (strain SB210) TaxID=312017 RepID=W7XCK2_TETTS|nr:DNA topoisomerase, putative [Tetrahymena thermophila SB210]EWS71501.1 DNA topoisomerase, putative [Tetrahymena thermophila SB210]|eukprot:XP_012655965.1 DNA topoisomerase, putative [Tetrahymena thermophila SB210]